jgi:hypothetical protein
VQRARARAKKAYTRLGELRQMAASRHEPPRRRAGCVAQQEGEASSSARPASPIFVGTQAIRAADARRTARRRQPPAIGSI